VYFLKTLKNLPAGNGLCLFSAQCCVALLVLFFRITSESTQRQYSSIVSLSRARALSILFSLARSLSLFPLSLLSLSSLSLSLALFSARCRSCCRSCCCALSLSRSLPHPTGSTLFCRSTCTTHTKDLQVTVLYITHVCRASLHLCVSSLTPYPTSPLSHPTLHLLSHTLPYISSLTPYPTSPLSHPTLPLLSHTLPYISSLTPYPTSPLSYPILRIHTHERPQSHSRQSVLQRHNILHVCAVLHYIFRVSSLTPYPTYPHTRKISKSRSTVRITKTYF